MTRILAVDVGVGTQDILVYDASRNPENNIKLVLPAMTQVLAKRIRQTEGDVFICGETMGGGPLSSAVMEHIKKGYSVVMVPAAAMSIRDNLEEVRAMGVEIGDGTPRGEKFETFETMDFDFEGLFDFLSSMGEGIDFDSIGIAVQDHGYAVGKSDREFRFEKFKEALARGADLTKFLYQKPPEYFTRMNAVLRTAKKFFHGPVCVVDTKIAAIAGALHDVRERPILAMDVGNGHTMVALIGDELEILGLMEHHTWLLNKEKLEDLVVRFADGKLTNEEVYADEGHGCHIQEKVGFENVKRILATGPNRGITFGTKLKVEYPTPMGDVMMTGPQGIVDLIEAAGGGE
ncbi:MAG: DUF1786 domain-containing protein [Candidatus Hydrothermarchaeaceae archaeon]